MSSIVTLKLSNRRNSETYDFGVKVWFTSFKNLEISFDLSSQTAEGGRFHHEVCCFIECKLCKKTDWEKVKIPKGWLADKKLVSYENDDATACSRCRKLELQRLIDEQDNDPN